MALRRDSPYIRVTWLTKLLAGEDSCEWAAWFRSQHEVWSREKVPGASTWSAGSWFDLGQSYNYAQVHRGVQG